MQDVSIEKHMFELWTSICSQHSFLCTCCHYVAFFRHKCKEVNGMICLQKSIFLRGVSKYYVMNLSLKVILGFPKSGIYAICSAKNKGFKHLGCELVKNSCSDFRIAWKNNRVIGVLSSNHDGRRLLFPSQNSPRKNCIASPPSNLQRLDLWELWLSDQLLRQRSLHLWLSLLDRWKQESMSRHFCSIGVERWHLLMQQRLDHPLGLQRWWGLWLSGLRGRACSHLWILWSLPVDLWSFHVLWWHTARLLHWRCPSTPLRQLSWICHRLRLCGRWRLRLSSMWRWRVYLWRLWSMSSNLWGLRHMRPRSLSWLGYFHQSLLGQAKTIESPDLFCSRHSLVRHVYTCSRKRRERVLSKNACQRRTANPWPRWGWLLTKAAEKGCSSKCCSSFFCAG